jgi:O-methyltransferase
MSAVQTVVYGLSKKSYRVQRFFHHLASHLETFLLNGYNKEPEIVNLITKVRKESGLLVTTREAFLVYSVARTQRQFPGDMVEVGVYKGGTAKLMCEVKGDVPLHLFDTFQGLPELHEIDRDFFREGWFESRLGHVQDYLRAYDQVYFYPGLFPDTAGPIADKTFSFVHIDADLYQSIVDCLEFFLPRLAPRGVILVHDYQLPGVKKAIADFLAGEPAHVIEMVTSYCMVMRL